MPDEGGLPGLEREMMVADFHMEGMSAMAVERLSGPAALDDPDCLNAS